MVAISDERKEEAATEFIKFLTASEQNMQCIEKTGYLPVTKQSFETDLQAHLQTVEDARIKKMLTAVLSMYGEYAFFTAPNLDNLDEMSSKYESDFTKLLTDGQKACESGNTVSAADALAQLIK